jgi:hypothetical protein
VERNSTCSILTAWAPTLQEALMPSKRPVTKSTIPKRLPPSPGKSGRPEG